MPPALEPEASGFPSPLPWRAKPSPPGSRLFHQASPKSHPQFRTSLHRSFGAHGSLLTLSNRWFLSKIHMAPSRTPISNLPAVSSTMKRLCNVSTSVNAPPSRPRTTLPPSSGSAKGLPPQPLRLPTSFGSKPSTVVSIATSPSTIFWRATKTPWPTMLLVCYTCLIYNFSLISIITILSINPGKCGLRHRPCFPP
jgi:hypothetical protein